MSVLADLFESGIIGGLVIALVSVGAFWLLFRQKIRFRSLTPIMQELATRRSLRFSPSTLTGGAAVRGEIDDMEIFLSTSHSSGEMWNFAKSSYGIGQTYIQMTLSPCGLPKITLSVNPKHSDDYLRSVRAAPNLDTGNTWFDERFRAMGPDEGLLESWLTESRRTAIAVGARNGVFIDAGRIVWRSYKPPENVTTLEQTLADMRDFAQQLR